MSRKIVVAGNWKMNLNLLEATKLTDSIAKQVSSSRGMEVVLCPPFLYTASLVEQLRHDNRDISVGAQNCHERTAGAYTGEISAEMLASCGAKYVLIGHSERRQYNLESAELLRHKIDRALEAGLHIIYCLGETLDQRQAQMQNQIVAQQLLEGVANLPEDKLIYLTVAYEPIWAIGTGETASANQAQEMHAFIRAKFEEMHGKEAAERLCILYGGSVKPSNAGELFELPDVDGGLVGGASLDEHGFIAIVRAAQSNL